MEGFSLLVSESDSYERGRVIENFGYRTGGEQNEAFKNQ